MPLGKGDLDMVQLFWTTNQIKVGATCNYVITVLMVAAKGGNFHVIKEIVYTGCSFDTTSVNGNRARSLAQKQGHMDIVLFLNDCLDNERALCLRSLF